MKHAPNDKIAKAKYRACAQEVRRIEFEQAIESEQTKPASESIDLNLIRT